MATTTMKGWQFQYPGAAAVDKYLTFKDTLPRPAESSVGPEDVLVKVIASGLNPADYRVIELGLIARAILPFPKTAGIDFSGEIVSVGSKVTDVKTGDKVVGRVNPFKNAGALSEYVVTPRSYIAVLPPSADVVTAAGIPTAALTAYQSIAPHVTPGKGTKVFINGGSGGAGSCCIQIAKLLGCHVTVSCSTAKVDLCRQLGADEIIDYKRGNVTEELQRRGRVYALIVDNVGDSPADLYSSSREYLGDGRPYVFVGGHMSLSLFRNLLAAFIVPTFLGGVRGRFVQFLAKDVPEDLEQLVAWFAEGKLRIGVESTHEFADAKLAFQKLQAGSLTGKIIVTV